MVCCQNIIGRTNSHIALNSSSGNLNIALPSTRSRLAAFDITRHAVMSLTWCADTTTPRTAWSTSYLCSRSKSHCLTRFSYGKAAPPREWLDMGIAALQFSTSRYAIYLHSVAFQRRSLHYTAVPAGSTSAITVRSAKTGIPTSKSMIPNPKKDSATASGGKTPPAFSYSISLIRVGGSCPY